MQAGILRISALAIACTVVSCADSTRAPAGSPVSLSFSTAAAAGASLSRSADASAAPAADNIEITSAQLVVARMELQSTGASCTSEAAAGDDDHDEHECAELNVGPTIVSLPIGSDVTATLEGTIPAGSYSALEARIRPIRADGDRGKASADFLAKNPDWAGKSLIVKGKINGTTEFTYTGTPRAEFETRFDPPLVVGTDPVNITVHVDMSRWFLDSSGAVIDPATTDPVKQAQIAQNIRRSFRAFRDDDHDGHEDRHHD